MRQVYWHGPTYEIRRGTWFYSPDGSKFFPCDENLARQLEDGYKKFQPWKDKPRPVSSVPTSLSSQDTFSDGSKAPPATATASESKSKQRWALFGPYMNQFVVYTGGSQAWLHSDALTSKLSRAVRSTLIGGVGGTRLVRGWSEVEKLKTKPSAATSPNAQTPAPPVPPKKDDGSVAKSLKPEPGSDTTPAAPVIVESDEVPEDEDRSIQHLIFVIHGIGQKLGERVETVNFVGDCSNLRQTIKNCAKQCFASPKDSLGRPGSVKKPVLPGMPVGGGVQVLPVQWRHLIQFGQRKSKSDLAARDGDDRLGGDGQAGPGTGTGDAEGAQQTDEEEELTLEDITLDGVPSIRMLVSDVIVDVLLYMTPKYRQEMVFRVADELNRMYRLFVCRNPKFTGKFSIYGHSLGSLLAFDILSHQGVSPAVVAANKKVTPIGEHEVDLSEMFRQMSSAGQKRSLRGLMEHAPIQYPKLEFEVDKLFLVGSPVGLFLLLKNNKLRGWANQDHVLEDGISRPLVRGLYNIFHPHDPVAYRIEPLVDPKLASIKPHYLQYTKGGLKGTIVGIQDLGNDIVDRGRSIYETMRMGIVSTTAGVIGLPRSMVELVGFKSSLTAPASAPSPTLVLPPAQLGPPDTEPGPPASVSNKRSSAILDAGASSGTSASASAGAAGPGQTGSKASGSKSQSRDAEIRLLNPRGRLDYALQEGVLENAYLAALGVHMNYWSDTDVALFMLKEIYTAEDQPLPASAAVVSTGPSGAPAAASKKEAPSAETLAQDISSSLSKGTLAGFGL
ncbi:DDHD domain-containing protein [Polychytrium aggregatum]|uniref:DDHD domain-containing protein n=1 Tax=Polychytrium aggregatum TaxID=110093 RepID=UPI0022FF15D9|nr:DDHD domain-containing protein [Polychytrium aggregatum]KAI9205292.1 DDHD domain-containing protein [Polychytrium aggregatum]